MSDAEPRPSGEWHAELRDALAHAGLRPRAIHEVTTIRFHGIRRGTVRVDLASGARVKARLFADEATARQLVAYRHGLPDAFVRVVSCCGRVVLEEWADGRLLESTPPCPGLVTEAARLMATLHASVCPTVLEPSEQTTERWCDDASGWLQGLVYAGALARTEARFWSQELRRLDPGRFTVGLGHFDLCGENMLLDASNRLRVFDNERVGPGPFGFDLARTWYRWNLPNVEWLLFQSSYATATARPLPFADHAFWRIVVLLQSASLRARTAPTHLTVPLVRLRQLAAAMDNAVTG